MILTLLMMAIPRLAVKMHGRSLVLMRRMSPYQDSPWLMGTLKEAMAPMVVVVD